jgi:hypothetical protein
MIRSEDNGDTWSEPIRVNQDPSGQGKKHYMGWITSDPATGSLSMVFYDDRNASSSQVQAFCANSFDGGNTWEDFQVSDVTFTPSPIPGLASQYFGDYLGISARNGKVYPVWTDNRTGTALTYCSPYVTSTMAAPTDLTGIVEDETGAVTLSWSHTISPTFDHYNVYRGLSMLGTTSFPYYLDTLPAYGSYRYQVTAFYNVEGESGAAIADVQWGNAQAEVTPGSVEAFLTPDATTSVPVSLANPGELPLEYTSGFSLPSGSREILDYCTGIGGCGEGISGVSYGTVTNFSGCTGYEDYSAMSYVVTPGETITVTVNNSTNIYPNDICGIWVDWNHDGSLLDDEDIVVNGSPGVGPYTASITVPDNAQNGETRMRIRIRRGGTLSPCGSAPNGEVEDYSLNVLAWVTAAPKEGTIEPGSAQDITFSFNSAGLAVGAYHADYTLYSNDPDNAELVVPVTLNVGLLGVDITSDKDSLCYGGSTTLHANITGGSGNFTYTWTSDPPGFNSNEPEPMVSPLVSTTYYVEVSDGSITLEDNIAITVISLPQVNLGEDISVCQSGQAIFDAGAGFPSYLWSNGQTGQSITVTEPGIYWVEVTNDFGCSRRDSAEFIINPLPMVNLGADQAFCNGTPVMLSAGTGFASYLWNTGDVSYYINISEPGEYWVEVTDANGCSNRDTISLTMNPLPQVDLGADQTFCQGSSVTLDAGSGFASYLWNTGATSATINADDNTSGEYWVEVTDANNCSNRDTIYLTIDPLPVLAGIVSGPTSVDNYLGLPSDFVASASTFATSYEWQLEPVSAGTISGTGLSAQVTWSAGFTGNADVTLRGVNDCGAGPYSQKYTVEVYSSQEIGEKQMISNIKLYPNPNDGNFILQFNSKSEQEMRFRITASGGSQILENKESIPAGLYQKDFNMGTLPAGTYYLVISDVRGRMLSRQQIVVK